MQHRLISLMILLAMGRSASAALDQQAITPEERARKERLRHTILLPFKFIADYGADNGELSMLQIRPLYTISTKRWNIINRPVIPIIDINGTVGGRPELPSGGGGDASGLGDFSYTFALEAKELKPVSFALGAAAIFPTASEDALGSGKYSAGPALMAMTRQESWTALIQARQVWSFAGDSQRADVNNFALEPIITYELSSKWYVITDPAITANWELDLGDRWLVPLGGGGGYGFSAWKQPADLRFEAYYNAIKSDNAPDWSLAITFTLIFQ